MSIETADLVFYKSAVYNDTGSNGGAMSANALVSAVAQNIFPVVNQSERVAGSTKYRKLFAKNNEDTGLALLNGYLFIENLTPAADRVYMIAGTQTNIQSALTGSERRYVCGLLSSVASIGESVISVAVEASADNGIQIGDRIRISDKKTIDSVNGNEEEFEVTDAQDQGGDVWDITIDGALANNYATTGDSLIDPTRVASMMPIADLIATSASEVVTSSGGTYDFVGTPIVMDNQGAVNQSWTLTFTSTSAFNIVGNILGNIGTGTIAGGASPLNPDFSTPYFTLESGGFGGAFAINDSITFVTVPAAAPFWLVRVVPAGMASLTGNKFYIAISGESE